MSKKLLYLILFFFSNSFAEEKILHASFDVTRELFAEINSNFEQKVKILQSHGGSGKQTSAVIHGLKADIVSLAMAYHMDLLANKNVVDRNWRSKFPANSSPMSTYIVFLVRKDNPKNIKDWQDLLKEDVKIVTGNPKTSGGALWNYVSAFIFASEKYKEKHLIENFIAKLYKNVPVLDSTARNSAITFLKRHIGDVLITWESEAKHIIHNIDANYEIIEPSVSVKIDIPVAVALNTKSSEIANKYINFLYSAKGQEIIKKHYYHSFDEKLINSKLKNADHYINWQTFKQEHFADEGLFEKIYR